MIIIRPEQNPFSVDLGCKGKGGGELRMRRRREERPTFMTAQRRTTNKEEEAGSRWRQGEGKLSLNVAVGIVLPGLGVDASDWSIPISGEIDRSRSREKPPLEEEEEENRVHSSPVFFVWAVILLSCSLVRLRFLHCVLYDSSKRHSSHCSCCCCFSSFFYILTWPPPLLLLRPPLSCAGTRYCTAANPHPPSLLLQLLLLLPFNPAEHRSSALIPPQIPSSFPLPCPSHLDSPSPNTHAMVKLLRNSASSSSSPKDSTADSDADPVTTCRRPPTVGSLSKRLTVARILVVSRSRMQVWLIRLSTSILLWTCLLQVLALGGQLWRPYHLLFHRWPSCFSDGFRFDTPLADQTVASSTPPLLNQPTFTHLQPRSYVNNGYLLVSCNGGLNQMRAAICDMVAVARLLNLTLIMPELDKTSFWADPSDFGDIFDMKHFIASLRDEVRIIKEVPEKFRARVAKGLIVSLPPVSWSDESYYLKQILPLIRKHKILHFSKTDTRVANGGLSNDFQKLRCRVNYEALRFTPHIEKLGQKLIRILKANGPFIVLHLRYEMDMLAFSGCTHGCNDDEEEELTRMRYAYPWWKEKIIDSKQKRLDGLCPLTPEETLLILKALGYGKETQIYIAAGEIYGSQRRMAGLHVTYPNIVRKEMLLSANELRHFQNHSSQMAALDYLVALESDAFIPTYDGNMAKLVEGHRRYLGYRKTMLLDRKLLVELIDQYQNKTLQWDEFSFAVQTYHRNRTGIPAKRKVITDRPKEEDYFYANPYECLR